MSTENKRSCLSRLSHVFGMLAAASMVFGVLLLLVYIGALTHWHNDLISQGIVVFFVGLFLGLRVLPLIPGANVRLPSLSLSTSFSLPPPVPDPLSARVCMCVCVCLSICWRVLHFSCVEVCGYVCVRLCMYAFCDVFYAVCLYFVTCVCIL